MRCIPARSAILDALDLVGVEQQLEDVVGLGVKRELRVVHLVGEGPERRRLVDPDEEVGEADPAVVDEARLVDDLAPGAHGRLGRGGRGRAVRLGVDAHDIAAVALDRGEELVLVAAAALEDDLAVRARELRHARLAAQRRKIEPRAVLAAQEVVQSARREHPPRESSERGGT
jgi:hypothetical protein